MLSATNLLATAFDFEPGFDHRLELRSQPAIVAIPAWGNQKAILELPASPPEQPLVLNANAIPTPLVARLEMLANVGFPVPPAAFSAVLAADPVAADPLAARTDSTGYRSELLVRRTNEEVFLHLIPPLSAAVNDRLQVLPDRFGDSGFIELGKSRPEFVEPSNWTPESFGAPIRSDVPSRIPNRRHELLLPRPAANTGVTLDSGFHAIGGQSTLLDSAAIAEPSLRAGTSIDLSSQQLQVLRDGLASLPPSQKISDEHVLSSGRKPRSGTESPPEWISKPLTESLTDLSFANDPDARDNGSVDFDATNPSTHHSRRKSPLPEDNSWWHSESHRLRSSFWLEFSRDVESRLTDDTDDVEIQAAESEIADAHSQVDMQQGGMVELIAAASSKSTSSRQSPPSSTQPLHTLAAGLSGVAVQIDTGVGMFQAFEIATSPQQTRGAPGLTISEDDLPIVPTAVHTSDKVSPTDAVISEEIETADTHAASIPAVLVFAALVFQRKRKVDENSEESPKPMNG